MPTKRHIIKGPFWDSLLPNGKLVVEKQIRHFCDFPEMAFYRTKKLALSDGADNPVKIKRIIIETEE